MDLDASLRDLPLTEENVYNTMNVICSQPVQDDVVLKIVKVTSIRPDDIYGGYRVKITAIYDTIETPFSVDISTGDVITPQPVRYTFRGIFDKEKSIELWAYNIETILSEKLETILSRTTLNTRARDFYDIFILETTQLYDASLLKEAFAATMAHRGTSEKIADIPDTLKLIIDSVELRQMWDKYRREFNYATDITYEQVIEALDNVISCMVQKTPS
jgi:hypothetical protein